MRIYSVVIIQFIIWSGFTLIEWLSTYDWFVYKIIMFFIFFYLAITIGNQILRSSRKTMAITILSLFLYNTMHLLMIIII
ncbi:MAG TPA: hypothetical protein VIG98_00050 [Bacillus sp. (in: firmicutes)]